MINDSENSDDYKKIFSFHKSIADRIISRESSWLEFKGSFNLGSRDKNIQRAWQLLQIIGVAILFLA
jgi:hypothetical protein